MILQLFDGQTGYSVAFFEAVTTFLKRGASRPRSDHLIASQPARKWSKLHTMPEDFPTPPPPPPAAPPYTSPYASTPASGYPVYGLPPKKRRSPWFWVAIFGGGFAVMALLITAMVWSTVKNLTGESEALDGFGAGSKIGVIDISGVILDPDKVDNQLRKLADDSSVKAIILHINSPGGGAAASQEI